MTKWEYTTQQTSSDSRSYLAMLAGMGEAGWELTSVLTFGEPKFISEVYYTFFFKRPVPGGISPDEIQAAKECLRDAGSIDMTRAPA